MKNTVILTYLIASFLKELATPAEVCLSLSLFAAPFNPCSGRKKNISFQPREMGFSKPYQPLLNQYKTRSYLIFDHTSYVGLQNFPWIWIYEANVLVLGKKKSSQFKGFKDNIVTSTTTESHTHGKNKQTSEMLQNQNTSKIFQNTTNNPSKALPSILFM